MTKLQKLFNRLFAEYGPQGWWPIINPKTLICEYNGGPTTDNERFEVAIGAVLAQNTQWYPNVVRSLQQLKLGRPFTEEELEGIREAERLQGRMFEKPKKKTKSEMLTQNTTWKNVEKAIINLTKNNLINPNKIIEINIDELAQIIKPAGYYNQKAKKLKVLSEFILKNPNLKDLDTNQLREKLLSINGIGPETADSISLYAFNKPTPIVDTYTKRIFSRFGFIDGNYSEIQEYQEEHFPIEPYRLQELHALLVEHAKLHCTKNNPDCWMCPVCNECKKNY